MDSPGTDLANQMYPDPVVETPVVETPVEIPEVETPEAETPEGETPVELVAEPEVENDEIEVKSIEELAEHFEVDPEWIQGLEITQKVNGKDVPVLLADALSTHRKVKAGDTYLSEAKDKAKHILAEVSAEKEQLAGSVAQFSTLVKNIEDEINADTKNIDWQALRKQDPAEYSAKKEDIKERRERVEAMKLNAANTLKQAVSQAQLKGQQARLGRLPAEEALFLDRIPEWKDEEKSTKEHGELIQYLTTEGFSTEEIEIASFNGKVLAMVVKAMRYDQSKSKSKAIEKKVRTIPKVLKPGKTEKTKPNVSTDRVDILYG